MRVIICTDCHQLARFLTDLDQYAVDWSGLCERCGGRTEVDDVVTAPASDQTGLELVNRTHGEMTPDNPVAPKATLNVESTVSNAHPEVVNDRGGGRIRRFLAQYRLEATETRHARRVSRDLLALYQATRAASPDLPGRMLYKRIVTLHTGLDQQGANTVVWRAEQSFAAWPNEREVQFRDVVLYLAIDEYLRTHAAREGTQTNMGIVVARVIPAEW